jgi:hypothetical protein
VQILITRLNRDVAFAGDIPDSDFRQNTCTAEAIFWPLLVSDW